MRRNFFLTFILILALAVALAGCAAFGTPPSPPPSRPPPPPSPPPSPTPSPVLVFEMGEPAVGIISSIGEEEGGYYLLTLETQGVSVYVFAQEAIFSDSIGERAAFVNVGDRVEVVFDAPIYDGYYAGGTATSVEILMYADPNDYADPFVAALIWACDFAPELNVGAVSISIATHDPPADVAAAPPLTAVRKRRIDAALQSFCLQQGYSVAGDLEHPAPKNPPSDCLVITFAEWNGEDSLIVEARKTRPGMGDAGAQLDLALDGMWKVTWAHQEYANVSPTPSTGDGDA